MDQIDIAGARELATGPVNGYRATRSATATRTDTALRDSPQSVQVVPRDVLVEQQDVRLTDALQNVSNVQPAGTIQGRSDVYVLRGFNTQTYAIDGFLLNPASTFQPTQRDLADVERIEVLKGPTSVLYGRGDPGGLINIVTRQPTLLPTGEVSVLGGAYGLKRTQGNLSSAIAGSDTLAGRLSFGLQNDDTFRNFGGRGNSREFVAPAVSWTPDPETRVYINTELTRQQSVYDEGLIAYKGRVPLDDIARFYGEPWSRYDGAFNVASLRIEHDFGSALTFRQGLNVQWGDFDAYAPRAVGVNAAGTTVSRRLTTAQSSYSAIDSQTEIIGRFDLLGFHHTSLLGFEYADGQRHSYQEQGRIGSVSFLNPVFGAAPGGSLAFQSDIDQKLNLFGTYLQDQVELGHGLQLVLGTRVDAVDQYYYSRTTAVPHYPADQTLTGVSPRAGLVWRPWEPLTLYASYSTSFKPQTANVLNVTAPAPETGVQYEVGARYDIIPERLTLSGAAFKILRDNVAATDPRNSQYSIITGQQESNGVEADLAGEILPGWKVIGGVGYLDAGITKDTTYAIGNKLPAVPSFSGSVWSTYQIQDGTLRGLGFGGGITYVGSRYGDIANTFKVDGYARLDATVFYDIDKDWRLAVNGRNLTNARYIEQPFNQFNNQPGAPLTVLASATARF